jgi:hypothetical protein
MAQRGQKMDRGRKKWTQIDQDDFLVVNSGWKGVSIERDGERLQTHDQGALQCLRNGERVKRQIWCSSGLSVGESHDWLPTEEGIGEMMTTNITANAHKPQIASLHPNDDGLFTSTVITSSHSTDQRFQMRRGEDNHFPENSSPSDEDGGSGILNCPKRQMCRSDAQNSLSNCPSGHPDKPTTSRQPSPPRPTTADNSYRSGHICRSLKS